MSDAKKSTQSPVFSRYQPPAPDQRRDESLKPLANKGRVVNRITGAIAGGTAAIVAGVVGFQVTGAPDLSPQDRKNIVRTQGDAFGLRLWVDPVSEKIARVRAEYKAPFNSGLYDRSLPVYDAETGKRIDYTPIDKLPGRKVVTIQLSSCSDVYEIAKNTRGELVPVHQPGVTPQSLAADRGMNAPKSLGLCD